MRRTPVAASLATLTCLLAATGQAADSPDSPEPGPRRVEFSALYTADALWNVHGGLREGWAYLDYIELAAGADLGRVPGVGDLSLYTSVFRRNDPTFSERYVGDSLVVSNIDATSPMKVLEAWVDWGFEARGRGSLRLGMYDLSSEFDVLDSRAVFLNSAYGTGHDLAQAGASGPSLFPDTALGARLAWAPHDAWLLKVAVLDGVPGDPEDRGRSRLHLSSSEGALWIAEVTSGGSQVRAGAGYWRYTAAYPVLYPLDADGTPDTRNDNAGGYLMAELASEPADGANEPRWLAFARAGTAEERINVFNRFYAAGVVYRSTGPGRYGSYLGLAASEARVGSGYREQRAAEGLATAGCERNVELTWRLPLGKHAAVQPDLQYVQNPSGDPQIPDAWVVGLRLELFFAK
jgi:porin